MLGLEIGAEFMVGVVRNGTSITTSDMVGQVGFSPCHFQKGCS
jgi:hypothetical protein